MVAHPAFLQKFWPRTISASVYFLSLIFLTKNFKVAIHHVPPVTDQDPISA